jgi:hypothetical protein
MRVFKMLLLWVLIAFVPGFVCYKVSGVIAENRREIEIKIDKCGEEKEYFRIVIEQTELSSIERINAEKHLLKLYALCVKSANGKEEK